MGNLEVYCKSTIRILVSSSINIGLVLAAATIALGNNPIVAAQPRIGGVIPNKKISTQRSPDLAIKTTIDPSADRIFYLVSCPGKNTQTSVTSSTPPYPEKLPVPDVPIPESNFPNFRRRKPLSQPEDRTLYQVIVSVEDANQEAIVRSLYSDAFTTVDNGKSVLQVGVFSNLENALNILQNLKDVGLTATILY